MGQLENFAMRPSATVEPSSRAAPTTSNYNDLQWLAYETDSRLAILFISLQRSWKLFAPSFSASGNINPSKYVRYRGDCSTRVVCAITTPRAFTDGLSEDMLYIAS